MRLSKLRSLFVVLVFSAIPVVGWAGTDGDGVSDADEMTLGSSPTDADTDDDGLTDGEEVALGTSPILADTDGDGVDDGVEVRVVGTDPLVADSSSTPPLGLGPVATFVGGTSGISNLAQAEATFASNSPDAFFSFVFPGAINLSDGSGAPSGSFNASNGAPDVPLQSIFGADRETFTSVFSGWLYVPPCSGANCTNTYTFFPGSDDGMRFRIWDGNQIVSSESNTIRSFSYGPRALVTFPAGGGLFPFELLGYENTGRYGLELTWIDADRPVFNANTFSLVPQSHMLAPDVAAEYAVDDLNGGTVEVGDTVEVSVTLTNSGQMAAYDLEYTAIVPGDMTFDVTGSDPSFSATAPFVRTEAVLAVGDVATFSYRLTIDSTAAATTFTLDGLMRASLLSDTRNIGSMRIFEGVDDPLASDTTDTRNDPVGLIAGGDGDDELVILNLGDDISAPSLSVTTPLEGEVVGAATSLVQGTTDELGATVTVTFDPGTVNEVVVTTTADATTGAFMASPPMTLGEGAHVVEVSVSDTAGNTSTETVNFSIDLTAPSIAISAPSDGSVVGDARPSIAGTTNTPAGTSVTITLNSGAADEEVATVTTDSNGDFSYTPATDLPEGSNTLDVSVMDGAGNMGSDSVAFEVDTSPPTITIVTPAPGAVTSDLRASVGGATDEAGATITLVFYAGTPEERTETVMADATLGAWSYAPTVDWLEGIVTVEASVTDAFGRTTTVTSSFEVDSTDPSLVVIPVDGATLNTDTPTISGTTEPQATVVIVIDSGTANEISTTVTADQAGNFSFTSPALAVGMHSLDVTSTDAAGNSTSSSTTFDVQLMGAPVAITTPADQSRTSGVQPQITGTAAPGATVVLVIDSGTAAEEMATVTADSAGDWSYMAAMPLADGTHTIDAMATDTDGMTTSDSVSFTVDTTAPVVNILNPSDQQTVLIARPTIEVTTDSPNATATLIFDAGTANEQTVTVTTDANGDFSYTPTSDLGEGLHTVEVKVSDAAGNEGTDSVSFTVDTINVNVVISSPSNGEATNDTEPTISGKTRANLDVELVITDSDGNSTTATVSADASGNWSYVSGTLDEGSYTVEASVSDMGTTATDSTTFVVDTTPPSLTVEPADGTIVVEQRPTISGTTDPGATVTISVDGGAVVSVTADANGDFSFRPTDALSDGSHEFVVTATDEAGNSTSGTVTLEIDTTPPALTIANPEEGDDVNADSVVTVRGTADPGTMVTVFVNGNQVGVATADESGLWSVDIEPGAIGSGLTVIDARATDEAGNVGAATVNVNGVTAQDSDGDGLTDEEEEIIGTDPNRADTDGDGLRDGDEVNVHGTDPLRADTDDDGLDDGEEITRETNPRDADTDRDGLEDGDEVFEFGSDPKEADTDGGGVLDGSEVTNGTDPLDPRDDFSSLSSGRLAGGCGTTGATGTTGTTWVAVLLMLGFLRRRTN